MREAVYPRTPSSGQGERSVAEPENEGDAHSFVYALVVKQGQHSSSQMHFSLRRAPGTAMTLTSLLTYESFLFHHHPPPIHKEKFNSVGNQGPLT